MPKGPIPAEIADFLAKPNPSIIGTVRPDGAPVTVATWYAYDADSGRVLVNMDASRKRLSYLREDPRISLTVLADDWYSHVSLQGRVTEFSDDTDLSGIDRLSKLYTGQEYPNRTSPRVNAWIEVDRWHGWGGFKQQR
ncbi:PPOX class F420-dependent oxidoreductase [Microlunatus elymi]|uniref:PPOX class F420-dependent oxidoreductase n=1 Tax=Microlunatus elymi TaxID=2596828 RepID=A0A516Q1W6_9ACTN|nr:PPOX class F420-dependent oxidoreductase [Microlunatus elymi]QDP97417.1 PPOX class F420-dependent oxidoreductase [Microlunatus elymi]